jgi:peroxiredoxin
MPEHVSDRLLTLPANLPVPLDDGACDHLLGTSIPPLTLPSSDVSVNLAALAAGRAVLYVYPRTGRPDRPVPVDWDMIPGARGCTPQSCGFRDHAEELARLGARVAGLSAQPLVEQEEVAERLRLPYPVLADPELRLARSLGLPTFTFEGVELYKRVTLILARGAVEHVFYPVFPPDRNAADVVAWLRRRA